MLKISLPAGKWKTKLLALEHSGRLRPHQHTSYGSLLLVLMLAAVSVMLLSRTASAGVGDTSGQGSYGVYAVLPHLPPTTPVITSLSNNKLVTTDDTLTVSGSCSNGTTVQIYKNNILAGSADCRNRGFAIGIDLFIGKNTILARAYNPDGVPSEDSQSYVVTLQPPGASAGAVTTGSDSSTGNQFYITSDQTYRATAPGHSLSWPVTIIGGRAPYSLLIDWGDHTSQQQTRNASGIFAITHTYSKANASGQYEIDVTATDAQGSRSLLRLMVLVPPSATVTATSSPAGPEGVIQWASIVLGALVLIVIAFWVGEKRRLLHMAHAM